MSADELEEDDAQGAAIGDADTPDAANPKKIKRQRQKQALDQENVRNFWKRSMADPAGRKAIWDLLYEAGTFETRFGMSPNGSDCPDRTDFHRGEQSVGMRLYQTLLLIDTEGVAVMHREHDPRFPKPKKPKMRTASHEP